MSSITAITSLTRDGREAYKRGDYAKALEFFNRAIGRSSDPTPQLLDHLAATHDKLNDLPAALQAAKKCIRAGREDPTGYIRAGKILGKMGKESVALEIYAHGLRCVRHVGKGWEGLKRAHDEVLREVAPRGSLDPMEVLPRELAVEVLEYLSFRQRVGICRVSKGWTKLVRSEPNLWTHLDLSGARVKVKNSFVSVAINVAKGKLKEATLNKLWDFDKVLKALMRVGSLETLTLKETGLQGQNLVVALRRPNGLKRFRLLHGTEVGVSTLSDLMNALQSQLEEVHCMGVQRLDFRMWTVDFAKMQRLSLNTTLLNGIERFFDKLSTSALDLRSLTLVKESIPGQNNLASPLSLRNCSKLEYVNLQLGFVSAENLTLPPSVRILRLATNYGGATAADFFPGHDETNINQNALAMLDLPHLQELHLDFPGMQFDNVARQFAVTQRIGTPPPSPLSDLKSLAMTGHEMPAYEHFGFGTRLTKLEQLAFTSTLTLEDNHVDAIAAQLKNLRRLDLSGTAITGVAVRKIVEAGTVRELILNDCQDLGRDAVDWARTQGVKVESRMTRFEAGGRKVRY